MIDCNQCRSGNNCLLSALTSTVVIVLVAAATLIFHLLLIWCKRRQLNKTDFKSSKDSERAQKEAKEVSHSTADEGAYQPIQLHLLNDTSGTYEQL